MCTAINLTTKHHYFGRNLDLEYRYDENVVIAPRSFPLAFRKLPAMPSHHAIIGMATVVDGYPLYYDATNENGVSMAGLNFPGNAEYKPFDKHRDNVTPFEFIPWVLGQCANMTQVRTLLSRMHLLSEPFSEHFPLSPLHWMIAWKDKSIVVESTADGLHVYDNPVRVLTNNPPFPMQMWNLSNYMALSPAQPDNALAPALNLQPYSNGMGALGLPGDWSSASRFIRGVYALHNASCEKTEASSVAQFFHILSAVSMPRGCVLIDGKPEITVYSSCCNADTGVYYYTTYDNNQISAVDMRRENLDGSELIRHPMAAAQSIRYQN